MKKILIVIDMQKDFVNGALGTNDAVNIVPLVQQTVKRALEENTSVYFTQDTHTEQYMNTLEGKYLPIPHCIKDTQIRRIQYKKQHSVIQDGKKKYRMQTVLHYAVFARISVSSATH